MRQTSAIVLRNVSRVSAMRWTRAERQRDRDKVDALVAAVAHKIGDRAADRDPGMGRRHAAGPQAIVIDAGDFEGVRVGAQPLDESRRSR